MPTPEKWAELNARLKRLGISEGDLQEKFITGSGSGGQKINKTASCVYLKHEASGVEVKCQQSRSQAMNRFFARRLLLEKLEKKILSIQSAKDQDRARIRRQKKRRTRKQKEKMLHAKHHRSETKKTRAKVTTNPD